MFRVVQWATGTHGRELLPLLIKNPTIELAGVYVYAAEKHAADAGALCGLPDTGVKATRKIEDILALDADIVLHCPRLELTTTNSDAEVLALLRSGKNVLSLRGYQAPWLYGADYVAELEAACVEGGATLFGTGVEPGFLYDRLAPALSGLCLDLHEIRLDQWFDLRSRPANTIFNICFMNAEPASFTADAPVVRVVFELYREEFALIADHLGSSLESMTVTTSCEIAPQRIRFEHGEIQQGRVWGASLHYRARLRSGQLLSLDTNWFVAPIPGWETKDSFGIQIKGVPSLSLRFAFEDKFAAGYDPFHRAVAAHVINMIPKVCAAPPGVMTARPFTARGDLLAACSGRSA